MEQNNLYELLRKDLLDAMPAVEETADVRRVRFDRPLKIMMDGKMREGVVMLGKNTNKEQNNR